MVVVGCGFVEDGQSDRGGGWLWVCGGGAEALGLWRWGCGGGECVVVGLWRMAGRSVMVFGYGFVEETIIFSNIPNIEAFIYLYSQDSSPTQKEAKDGVSYGDRESIR
nr:hypothetical protein CFP56_51196 [Quercus suber]